MVDDDKTGQEDMRARDREEYLARLRGKAEKREIAKQQEKKAIELKAEHAAETAKSYLEALGRRHQFRAEIKEKMIEDSKTHHQVMRRLGQIYRRQLKWYIGRDLESDLDSDLESDLESDLGSNPAPIDDDQEV